MDEKVAAYDHSGHSNVQQLYNSATPLGSSALNMVHSDGADPSDKQPKRILLCFIDTRPTTPGFQSTAHYAMVALPSSYEAAALVAYKAFQSKMLANNIGMPGDIVLMIKGFVRFGESSTNVSQPSNIWADIYPPEDWIRILKDGDEILVCPKVPLIPTLVPVAHKPESVTSSRSANTNPGAGPDKTLITGPTVTLYCKPPGSSKYRQERVPFSRSLEELKASAMQAFGHLNESPVPWTKDSFQLYLNTTPIIKSGGRDRPNRHTSKAALLPTNWPSAAEAVMNDKSLFWEVEVVPIF